MFFSVSALRQCLQRREFLGTQGTTFYRAVHTSETQGLFSLERAGSVGVLSLYQPLEPQQEQQLAVQCLMADESGGLESIYLKRRPVEARHLANIARAELSPPLPLCGPAQPEVTVLEAGVPFLIRPAQDLSIGLFSDARPARAWVQQHSQGRRVLNTFAYTCGFGLSAALGGAEVVKNIDLSRKVLAWGQENYALSGLAAPPTDFLYGDVFDWLERLQRRGDIFDLVVLDPPAFARRPKGVWRAEKDYAALVHSAAQLLAQRGRLLCLLNHAGMGPRDLERQVGRGLEQAGRRARLVQVLGIAEDYPAATHLKMQVWQLDEPTHG